MRRHEVIKDWESIFYDFTGNNNHGITFTKIEF